MPRDADPDLAVYRARGRTIYRRRGRFAWSLHGPGKSDRVYISHGARRAQVAYAVVYSPTSAADRLDAPYTLTIDRGR